MSDTSPQDVERDMEHPPQDAQDTLENGPGRHFDDDSDNDAATTWEQVELVPPPPEEWEGSTEPPSDPNARPGDRRFDPAVLAAADLAIEQLRRDADTRESSRHEKRREFVRYYAALIIPYWEEEDNDEDDRGGVVCGTKSAEHYIYPSPPCQSSGWRTDAFSKL